MANIKHQFHFAINKCFNENIDKHSYKKEHDRKMDSKIFSYQAKFDLLDKAKTLSNYLRDNFSDVKQIKDIKASHIQAFLDSRVKNGCTQTTVNDYLRAFYKLENIANKVYKSCRLKWRNNLIEPKAQTEKSTSRGVGSVMTREEYDKIKEYCKNQPPSQSNYAIRLQDALGIRVNELSKIEIKNIDLQKGEILLTNTKGGKEMTRVLTEAEKKEAIPLLKEIIAQKFDTSGRMLFTVSPASINRQLGRIEEKLGFEKHSNHDIRRLKAQELYDTERKEGKTHKEAISQVSDYLNHSNATNREKMLITSYIKTH